MREPKGWGYRMSRARQRPGWCGAERLEGRVLLSTVVVNTTRDGPFPASAHLVSLRDSIAAANRASADTTITFDSTVFAARRTITLNGTPLELSGRRRVTIVGPQAGVIVSGNHHSGGLVVDSSATAVISRLSVTACGGIGILNSGTLTLNDASVSDNHPGPDAPTFGGGISNTGTLTLNRCAITGNTASQIAQNPAEGAGIYNAGPLTLIATTVSGNSLPGYFDVGGGIYNDAHGAAVLRNSTVSNNDAFLSGGIENYNDCTLTMIDSRITDNTARSNGGGMFNGWTATLVHCTISGNRVTGGTDDEGGGIDNAGDLTLTACTISGNAVTDSRGFGGGILSNGSSLTVTDSIISGNSAQEGAGIYNRGVLTMVGSTVSDNTATGDDGFGAGIVNDDASASIVNSTIARNSAQGALSSDPYVGGGGVYNLQGTLVLVNSTVADNRAAAGGGLLIRNDIGGVNTVLNNSIIADNFSAGPQSPDDIAGTIEDADGVASRFNLIGAGGGLVNGVNGNRVGVRDPRLASLGNYGGATPTMPPLAGSPAVDHGSNALVPAGVFTDQRGLPRIVNGTADIGAVESQPQVTALTLVDADTGRALMPLTNGITIDLSQLPSHLNVVATVTGGAVGSVVFGLDANRRFRIERGAPYSLFGDVHGVYLPGTFTAGAHTLIAQAFSDRDGTGPLGFPLTVRFIVINSRRAIAQLAPAGR